MNEHKVLAAARDEFLACADLLREVRLRMLKTRDRLKPHLPPGPDLKAMQEGERPYSPLVYLAEEAERVAREKIGHEPEQLDRMSAITADDLDRKRRV